MKTNFRKEDSDNDTNLNSESKNLTKEEFEDFIIKSGAKGSFMVYRSDDDDELGIDEL
jgi:hypothetical protein